MNADGPKLVSLTSAAKRLGIHRTTAFQQWKRGDFPIPVMQVGDLLKVNEDHLNRFIETGERTALAGAPGDAPGPGD